MAEEEQTARIDGTLSFAPVSGSLEPPSPGDDPGRRRLLRRGLIGAGAVVGVLIVLYGVALLLSNGSMPRGTTVAGVDLSGLSRSAIFSRTALRNWTV